MMTPEENKGVLTGRLVGVVAASACPGAPVAVADGCTTATHNVVYDVPKPVASSSCRRFKGKYDEVMQSRETGVNATHYS